MKLLVSIVIFLGSALLFCLQPMVGRTLLPAFGGTAAVWSVCLAAFQVLLVGGYTYAHVVGGLAAGRQRRAHVALLAVAVVWVFAVALVGLAWARGFLHAGSWPALEVLLVVLVGAGGPYLVLSAGSSLLQAWVRGAEGDLGMGVGQQGDAAGRGVYRLYAVSNLGSFFGLFAYPFLLEPFVPLRWQWLGWSGALAVYVVLVACVARRTGARVCVKNSGRGGSAQAGGGEGEDDALDAALRLAARGGVRGGESGEEGGEDGPVLLRGLRGRAWWYVLPGLSSFMLVATTNHLSMDVAPLPLLWAVLLGAFLLSYVAGFSHVGERWLPVLRVLALGALIASGYAARNEGSQQFVASVAAGVGLIFSAGTFLHGWLYSIRPEGARLTRFYLGVAVGGAVGGMAASFVAPVVFRGFWEYPVALVACACAGLFFAVCSWRREVLANRVFNVLAALACMWTCALVFMAVRDDGQWVVWRDRNFYGSLKVGRVSAGVEGGDVSGFSLSNGGTLHGEQVHDTRAGAAAWERVPTTYYGALAGGLALAFNPKWSGTTAMVGGGAEGRVVEEGQFDLQKLAVAKRPDFAPDAGLRMRVGAIGLGIGTMAAWGRVGDEWTFFEINPLVDKIARDRRFFTYVTDSRAAVRTRLGDARLALEREQAGGAALYDVLIVDAYTGDSVPLHLATREAFRLYAQRLAPDGVLALHISNWHMDLLPLCKAAAQELGMFATGVLTDGVESELTDDALWVFLTRRPLVVSVAGSGADLVDFSGVRDIRPPTDEWGSLQGLIRFNATTPVLARERSNEEEEGGGDE